MGSYDTPNYAIEDQDPEDHKMLIDIIINLKKTVSWSNNCTVFKIKKNKKNIYLSDNWDPSKVSNTKRPTLVFNTLFSAS